MSDIIHQPQKVIAKLFGYTTIDKNVSINATVTYENEDTEVKTYDPANLPEKSPSGSDAGWSLFYVGNSGETKGQEYIYPRADKKGNVEYKEYTAIVCKIMFVANYKRIVSQAIYSYDFKSINYPYF